jgi:hypothetical protein
MKKERNVRRHLLKPVYQREQRIRPDHTSLRESIVNSVWQVSWLVTFLPPFPSFNQTVDIIGKNLLCYLQLRDSP